MGTIEAFCFLFPVEILFEGFVGGFLKEIVQETVCVVTQTRDQYLAELVVDGKMVGKVFRLQEDILIETDNILIPRY